MAKEKKFIKYGGVEFELRTSEEEVNEFVDNLTYEAKENMREVVKALEAAGHIVIPEDPEFTTIDEDFLEFQKRDEREIHGLIDE